MDSLRSIEVSAAIPNIKYGSKGYFHRWCDQMQYYDGGPEDYPLRKTVALIEFLDGTIKLLDPETIRFLEPLKRR